MCGDFKTVCLSIDVGSKILQKQANDRKQELNINQFVDKQCLSLMLSVVWLAERISP